MKKSAIALALLLSSLFAQATELQFQFGYLVGITKSNEHIYLSLPKNGKIAIRRDSQRQPEVVDVVAIQDERIDDGELVLDLGQGRQLIETSGLSAQGIQFFYKDGNGKILLEAKGLLQVK